MLLLADDIAIVSPLPDTTESDNSLLSVEK